MTAKNSWFEEVDSENISDPSSGLLELVTKTTQRTANMTINLMTEAMELHAAHIKNGSFPKNPDEFIATQKNLVDSIISKSSEAVQEIVETTLENFSDMNCWFSTLANSTVEKQNAKKQKAKKQKPKK